MKMREVTTNKGNWSGEEITVKVKEFKNGEKEFKFFNQTFRLIFETENRGYVTSKGWDYDRFLELRSFEYDNEKIWVASDDEGVNISRQDTDAVKAVIQVLCNIL